MNARRHRSDRSGREDRRRLSGEEFFEHHAEGRSQWPLVENPAAGRRRQVHRRGFRGTESRCGVSRHHGRSAGRRVGEPAQRLQARKVRSEDVHLHRDSLRPGPQESRHSWLTWVRRRAARAIRSGWPTSAATAAGCSSTPRPRSSPPIRCPPTSRGPISGNIMRVDPNGKMVWSTAGTESWD